MVIAALESNILRDSFEATDKVCQRTRNLLNTEISFIANAKFHEMAEANVLSIVDSLANKDRIEDDGVELPPHLKTLCESELLTHDQEKTLFQAMNFLKFRANVLRSQLNDTDASNETLDHIDELLSGAQVIRDHIIKTNIRLVMSIVKKFVTPQQSFDELLSDGILTLMNAVEKFDYDRGFRFSTYAYRSIARKACRTIKSACKEEGRITRDAEEWAFEDESCSAAAERAWMNLRQLATGMLDNLDRRERFIIRSRYALGAHRKVRSFQYLGDKLGVSKERVRQLEQRAIAKLKVMAEEFDMDEVMGAALV